MTINTFFLRVAASCNLDCDYCYVFKHRDMSWKNMPRTMTDEVVIMFAQRLKEYAHEHSLETVNIIFHGGEPLMCGEKRLLNFVDIINSTLGDGVKASYSMQTNGTLLTDSFLDACIRENIGVSLSVDGHATLHNKHRKYKNGTDSHQDVVRGIELLKKHPAIFEGVIGVIDPYFDPEDVLSFFDTIGVENVDLLLPDSTYQDLPAGRSENPNLYKDWLIRAFDAWFFNHQSIHLRTFEHILTGVLGENSALDAFGLGCLDYLTIETDGTYHTSDILKVAFENASAIGFGVSDGSIEDALKNEKVVQYNELLKLETLPEKCKLCEYAHLCGGGSLPHRYDEATGFNNPTIYCGEMFALISHAIEVVQQTIADEINNGL